MRSVILSAYGGSVRKTGAGPVTGATPRVEQTDADGYAEVFRESNDLLIYLAGLSPEPGDSMNLAQEENQSDGEERDAKVRKPHNQGPHVTRQIARSSVVGAAQ